ncbi:MAG TPA: sulfatase-like hydrolase/transferase [Sphingomonas sp.]|nr:sulfatase-like hydrolase/transferase [Sphingomonas sp.]
MQRRDFLKAVGSSAVASSLSAPLLARGAGKADGTPNIIVFMCDQWSYGTTKATGLKFDTMPTLDRLQREGVGFARNYCTAPLCVPSRISMLTGRWPEAHRVRMNLAEKDAFFDKDMYQVAKGAGYRTALVGKNHSYLNKDDLDVWIEYFHGGGPDTSQQQKDYDRWLTGRHFNVSNEPTPFPVTMQLPYRIVSDAMSVIDQSGDNPFMMWVSLPEPHNPEQVPAPYWNMFPPEEVPDRCGGPELLPKLGERLEWEYRMQQTAYPPTESLWRRYRSNYYGMLRLIDDQIKRLIEHLETTGLADNTVVVFTSDHGDSLMNFGIGHKGLGLRETVTHTPMVWWGPGIRQTAAIDSAFTSMADLMPTLCEMMGQDIPHGVQGRSLLPLLRGEDYPKDEFRSAYTGVGVGGLYYETKDNVPLAAGLGPTVPGMFDELNMVTLSGNQKMVRMGDWKLVYDMMGYGQLYDLAHDPCELTNLFGQPQHAKIQADLMAELAMWVIRSQDSLPTGPQNKKYQTKWPAKHNWYAPYRHGGSPPNAFIP